MHDFGDCKEGGDLDGAWIEIEQAPGKIEIKRLPCP